MGVYGLRSNLNSIDLTPHTVVFVSPTNLRVVWFSPTISLRFACFSIIIRVSEISFVFNYLDNSYLRLCYRSFGGTVGASDRVGNGRRSTTIGLSFLARQSTAFVDRPPSFLPVMLYWLLVMFVLAVMLLFCCMQRALQSIPGIQHRKGLPGRFCCFSWIMGPASSSIARRRPLSQTVGRPVGFPLEKLVATLGRLAQSPDAVSSLVGLRLSLAAALVPIDRHLAQFYHAIVAPLSC